MYNYPICFLHLINKVEKIFISMDFLYLSYLGPLAAKHRQIVSKNPMFNGLSAPANNNQSHKSLATLFPLW